jgi:hypothetical protein
MLALASRFAANSARVRELASPLSNAQFWQRPFCYGNSFGHLVLHLTGNLNYYIGAQIAKTGYLRDRPREFNDPNPPSKDEALKYFDDAVTMVLQTIHAQSPEDWSAGILRRRRRRQESAGNGAAMRRSHATPHRPDDLSQLRVKESGREKLTTCILGFLCVSVTLW